MSFRFQQSHRQYQPIWEKLKADGEVSVNANRLLHSRIIKAVIKEKWMDLGYKMAIFPYNAKLEYTQNHSILTFRLTKTINFSNLSLGDI